MTTGSVTAGGTVTTGIVGGGAATGLGVGVTGIVGTVAAELTPRLAISLEPRGIPVRGWPPGAVGVVGVEEAARLFEPEPHIPDIPAVSIAPEADMVELCIIPDVIDNPEVGEMPEDMPGEAPMLPEAAPVAGVEFATDVPPPS
jgi:hypothetical protein